MRTIFFTLLLTVLITSVNGQTSIHPMVSVSGAFMDYFQSHRYINSQVGGGVQIGAKWNILTYAGYSSMRKFNIKDNPPEHMRMNYYNWMAKGQYRFLSKSKFSPLIEIGIGTGFKSKYTNVALREGVTAIDTNYGYNPEAIVGYYIKTKALFTAKLYAVYRLNNFEFQIGGGYGCKYFEKRHPWKSDEITSLYIGRYEVSFGVNYTFKKKKD